MGFFQYYILLFFHSHFRGNVDVQRRVQNIKRNIFLQDTLRIATIGTVGRARSTPVPSHGQKMIISNFMLPTTNETEATRTGESGRTARPYQPRKKL
jgi:hypothetical protein